MNKKLLTILIILIYLVPKNVTAQKPFSEYLPDARSIALGWSAVALPFGPSAVYWNPANLAFLSDDQILINVNDVSRFNFTGFTKFFPPKIRLGINIFRSMSAQSKYELSSLGLGVRINSALALGSNINLGKMENGEFYSSFGFGIFIKSFPDYRNQINSSHSVWKWFRSHDMKNKISFGLTFHNISLQNIKNGQQLRAAIALKFSTYAPLLHFAYHLSPENYSFHFGTQVNLMKNIDLYFGIKDFDANQIAVGALTRFAPFSFELSYLPETKQYYFSFYFKFSENRIELAQKYKNRGAQYIKKNDFIRGLKEYKKAFAYNQEDDKLNLLISVLENRVNDRKKRVDLLYAKALKFEKDGLYGNAYLVYRNILEIDQNNKASRKRLKSITPKLNEYLGEIYQQAITYYKTREIDKANFLFDKILTINKAHKGAVSYSVKIDSLNAANFNQYYLRGLGYYEQKNYIRANQEFKIALAINPDHEKALDYKKSIDTLLEKKQQRIERFLTEAKTYERRKLFIRANNRYKKVLRLDKNNRYAAEKVEHLRKIISSIIKRKYQEARQSLNQKEYLAAIVAFREILSIDPSHRASSRYLKKAQQGLTKFIDEHFKMAQDYFAQKKWNEALDECNVVISLDNKHSAAQSLKAEAAQHISLNQLNQKAMWYYQSKDYLRAQETFKQILARAPNDQAAKQHLDNCEKELNAQIEEIFNEGMVDYSEGDYQEAIRIWTGVLKLDPNHKSTLEYIQKARERLKVLSDIK